MTEDRGPETEDQTLINDYQFDLNLPYSLRLILRCYFCK